MSSSHPSQSSFPAAPASATEVATAQPAPLVQRAKPLGGPIMAAAYPWAKAVVAGILVEAIRRHSSQRGVARAAGVTHRLVGQWVDPQGSNGLRLDVALAIADDGPEHRNIVVEALRAVLEVAEGLGKK